MIDSTFLPPEGVYLARVAEARLGQARSGAHRWAIRFDVEEGPFAGHVLAWDSLVFSPRGRARVKRILRALDRPMPASVDEVFPDRILGAVAKVQIRHVEFRSSAREENEVIRRTEVPYDGVWHRDDQTVSLRTVEP